jgi:hypothetical protein
MSDETKKIDSVPAADDSGRDDFVRTVKFHYLDGAVEDVRVAWPFYSHWQRLGHRCSDILEVRIHTFELVKLGYGRAAYFEGGIQHAIRLGALPRESVVVFRATGGDIVTVPTPAQHAARPTEADEPEPLPRSRYAVFTHHMHGDTTVIHPDHAQRLRAGLAELEREHVANNPRVIVQPDYPDWDDGEY